MSDQKMEDTKSPLARRGARPFVGPAGGSGAARPPLFKPVVPPTRVASTPALPPRPALGMRVQPTAPVASPVAPIVPSAPEPTIEPTFVAEQQPPAAIVLPPVEQIEDAQPVATPAPVPVEAVLPVAPLRPTTPAQTFDITIPEPVAAAETSPAEPVVDGESANADDWSVAVTPAYTPSFQSVIDEVPPADDVMSSFAETQADAAMSALDEIPQSRSFDAPEPPVTRPVTSEMVAIDAFEAFETVWDAAPEPEAALPQTALPEAAVPEAAHEMEAPMPDEPTAASPLDGESLGNGIDAQHLWGDEIAQDTGDYQAYEASAELATPNSEEDAPIEAGWASQTTPELPMPAWLEDDRNAGPTELFEQHDASADALPDALPPAAHEATANSIVGSAPNGSPWSDPRMAAYAAFVTSPDGVPAITSAIANTKHLRGLQVSAALQRLAERIREGEIDVSSVAPEAPDAAMLASVLAALLGGSSSR